MAKDLTEKNWIWLLPLLAVGFVLRFYGLSDKSFWFDEVHHFHFVTLNAKTFTEIFSNLGTSLMPEPPFYHLIDFFSVRIFGEDEFGARLPSAFAGGFFPLAVFLLARTFFEDKRIAFLACFFATISPYVVYYSQENKPYSFFLTFSSFSFAFFFRFLKNRKRSDKILYTTFTVLAVFSHYFMFFAVLSQLLALLVSKRDAIWNFKVPFAVFCFSYLVLIYLAKSQFMDMNEFELIHTKNFFTLIKMVMAAFSGLGSRFGVFFILLAVLGFCSIFLKERKTFYLFGAIIVFTIVVEYLFSLIFKKDFNDRYLIFLYPFLLISMACFFAVIPKFTKTVVIIVAFASFLINGNILYHYYKMEKIDYRSAAKFLDRVVKNGDLIAVFPGHFSPPLAYYLTNDDYVRKSNTGMTTKSGKRIWIYSYEEIKDSIGNRPYFIVTLDKTAKFLDVENASIITSYEGIFGKLLVVMVHPEKQLHHGSIESH